MEGEEVPRERSVMTGARGDPRGLRTGVGQPRVPSSVSSTCPSAPSLIPVVPEPLVFPPLCSAAAAPRSCPGCRSGHRCHHSGPGLPGWRSPSPKAGTALWVSVWLLP